jgi:hypothetical protein
MTKPLRLHQQRGSSLTGFSPPAASTAREQLRRPLLLQLKNRWTRRLPDPERTPDAQA